MVERRIGGTCPGGCGQPIGLCRCRERAKQYERTGQLSKEEFDAATSAIAKQVMQLAPQAPDFSKMTLMTPEQAAAVEGGVVALLANAMELSQQVTNIGDAIRHFKAMKRERDDLLATVAALKRELQMRAPPDLGCIEELCRTWEDKRKSYVMNRWGARLRAAIDEFKSCFGSGPQGPVEPG